MTVETASIFTLPPDTWIAISRHLTCANRASLSLCSKALLYLVDTFLWRTEFSRRSAGLLIDRTLLFYKQAGKSRRSQWWYACRYLALLEQAWTDAHFTAFHCVIPLSSSASEQTRRSQTTRYAPPSLSIPAISLTKDWLVVAARSNLFLLPTHSLPGHGSMNATALSLANAHRTQTNSRNVSSNSPPGPWQDVTKIIAIDPSRFIVSYADGNVQLLRMRLVDKEVSAEIRCHLPASVAQEVMSISHLFVSSSSYLVASVTKRGRLAIHLLKEDEESTTVQWTKEWQIQPDGSLSDQELSPTISDSDDAAAPSRQYRSSAFNNAPRIGGLPNQAVRAWSVLLGSGWIAVGTTSRTSAVHIYPFEQQEAETIEVGAPFSVASTTMKASVYAMAVAPSASSIPSFLLFVGYYDGVIRVYDTRSVRLSDAAIPARKSRRELDPVAVFRHKFEGDPIYSFAFGGPQGTHLAIGDARHARVRLLDVSMLINYNVPLLSPPLSESEQQQDQDWVAFAIPSSNSPTYGLVADADHLFGVTDSALWSFDFGLPLTPHCSAHINQTLFDRAHTVTVTPSLRI